MESEIDPNGPKMNGQDRPRKTQKRKRASLAPEEKEAQIESLKKELNGLFGYYEEVMGEKEKEKVKVGLDLKQSCRNSVNGVVAWLMEERELPLSKLVDEIYNEVKEKKLNDGVWESLTVAAVKSSVLFVGQRVMYGVPNAHADVLEDQSHSCLWCWEVYQLLFFFNFINL